MIEAAWQGVLLIGVILLGTGVGGIVWGALAWWDERRRE